MRSREDIKDQTNTMRSRGFGNSDKDWDLLHLEILLDIHDLLLKKVKRKR